MRLAGASFATVILIAGCSGYVRSRAADVADIARLNIGGGYGANVDASITRYVRFSVGGYEQVLKAGFAGRQAGLWKERRQGAAFIGGYTETSREPICGNALVPPHDAHNGLQPWYADKERGATEITVSVFFMAGLEVGVDPGQMLDFIVGLVGIDLYGDDRRAGRWSGDQGPAPGLERRGGPARPRARDRARARTGG